MTKKYPLSVIMSCYNEVAVVGRAIESILNQTFSDFEFVIVDDASTDGTYDLCQDYATQDERIRLFRIEENSGSCAVPLNFAIAKTTAPILARMDADDVSHLSRFEKQYDFLRRHPEVDVLGTGIRLISKENHKELGQFFYPKTHTSIVRNKYKAPFLAHPTVMLRKEVYTKWNGYDPHQLRVEDYDLWLKALPHFTFHNLQEILLDYYRSKLPKGQRNFYIFRNLLFLKISTMKKNREILTNLPVLIKDVIYFCSVIVRFFS
jgi:glycosyltransferase involved in cell wall biosynthesis